MESLFTVVFIIASGSDDTLWITILVFIILSACFALWSFLKKRDTGYGRQEEEDYYPAAYSRRRKWTWQFKNSPDTPESGKTTEQPEPAISNKQRIPEPAVITKQTEHKPVIAEVISPIDSGVVKVHAVGPGKPAEETEAQKAPIPIREVKSKRKANLSGGLELLESDFLIELVCDIDTKNIDDTKMKRIAFEELMHRSLLNQLPGTVLKEYSVNRDKLYNKAIQCAALRELAMRTRHKHTLKTTDSAIR